MPGYDLEINGEYARLDSLKCPSCKLILRDAIQTEEGIRLCKSCCDLLRYYINDMFQEAEVQHRVYILLGYIVHSRLTPHLNINYDSARPICAELM